MDFDIEKCAVLIMKSGKRNSVEEIEQLNEQFIWTLEKKENRNYSEILKVDIIKQEGMNIKIRKVCFRRARKFL